MHRIALLGVLLASACSGGKDTVERERELYDRLAYLRASYDTAYSDHNVAALDAVFQEMRRHALHRREIFLRDLKSGPPGRKRLAAFALAFSDKDKSVQEALLGVVTSDKEDSGTVEVSMIALGMLRMDDTPLSAFTDRFSHVSWTVRQAAIYGFRFQIETLLSKPGGKLEDAVLGALFERLNDAQMDVRNEAVIALRRIRTPVILEPILKFSLRDAHPLVRQNAAITLASLGPLAFEAVNPLIELLKDGDHKVVESAWTALASITSKEFDRGYAGWRDWYDEEEKRMEYVCVDHVDVSETAPGKCPTCSKRLLRQARAEDYRCPVHPDVRMGKAGKCPTCRRILEPRHLEYVCSEHSGIRHPRARACPTCSKPCVLVREIFTCTEHADVEAPFGGRCSRCDRDLVRRVDYLCSVHPDVHGQRHDRCRALNCGRSLVLFMPEYYCHEHPAIHVDRPGKCKVCQRDLSQVAQRFTCTKHPETDAPKAGKCSRCETDLVPKK